jgi:hypothetical protein
MSCSRVLSLLSHSQHQNWVFLLVLEIQQKLRMQMIVYSLPKILGGILIYLSTSTVKNWWSLGISNCLTLLCMMKVRVWHWDTEWVTLIRFWLHSLFSQRWFCCNWDKSYHQSVVKFCLQSHRYDELLMIDLLVKNEKSTWQLVATLVNYCIVLCKV